jgi:hypothetical protein
MLTLSTENKPNKSRVKLALLNASSFISHSTSQIEKNKNA